MFVELKVSFSFGGYRDGKRMKVGCFLISSIGVHPEVCSYCDRVPGAKVQNSEDLRILSKRSSLLKHRISRYGTSGMFKADEV